MRRFTAAVLGSLLIIVAFPVGAQEDARILKGDTRVPIQHDAPEGWEMFSLPLGPDALAELRSQPWAARKTMLIAISYSSILMPGLTAGIDAFDVMPLATTPYWQGVVLFNVSAASRNTTVKIRATGVSRQLLQGTFFVPGGSIVLIRGQFRAFGNGVVRIKVTATGAKLVWTAVCSGC